MAGMLSLGADAAKLADASSALQTASIMLTACAIS